MQVNNPLGSAVPTGWPLTWWFAPHGGSINHEPLATVANTYTLFGFSTPAQIRFNSIFLQIETGDAGHLYSFGIYKADGTLACASTPANMINTAEVAIAMAGGPFTINPGEYYFASTGNDTTATFRKTFADGLSFTFFYGNTLGATVAGALPVTITPPAAAFTQQNLALFALTI